MDSRLFTLDKNYILKEAQIKSKKQLLTQLIYEVKQDYLQKCNPLGLIDPTISSIRNHTYSELEYLDSFYFELAGIYRLKHGENQLEFLFDGNSHYIKYQEDWGKTFRKWIKHFFHHQHFIRAILEGSVLKPEKHIQKNVQIRLKLFLEQFFHLRIYKYRGIRKIQAA
jgi:hypothetical protein